MAGGAWLAATQVAATDTTVLLAGESGTGKEVVARFIHRASSRCRSVCRTQCAALPEQPESEPSATSVAHSRALTRQTDRLSRRGGVLFLDEVSEMSLRTSEIPSRAAEREFQRLGGTRVLKTNVRVIAATNRDLKRRWSEVISGRPVL
jgi:transcriptional regulator with GAF, ATPase, and Fis domain